MTILDLAPIRPPWGGRILWGLRCALAATFAASGLAKLLYEPVMVVIFAAIGSGYQIALIIGCLEIAGAIFLLVPATSEWGAALLALIAAGAVFTHILLIGGMVLPALLLLALCCAVIWDGWAS